MQWSMTFTVGNVITIATILTSLAVIYKLLLRPAQQWFQEHNLMWEDYSVRHHLPYRVRRGRGNTVTPEKNS